MKDVRWQMAAVIALASAMGSAWAAEETAAPANSAAAEPIVIENGAAAEGTVVTEGEACVAGCEECDPCAPGGHCNLGEPWTLQSMLFPCGDAPFTVAGWVQTGYHTRQDGMFNTHNQNPNLHQAYLYLERVADGSEGIDFGFRFDTVYGVDAPDTQAFGSEPNVWDNGWTTGGGYGWAIPQLYGEVAVGDLSVKVGHFYTLVGYEVVPATGNFFYSHSFTMYTNEPFTHTGALATYKLNDCTTVYGGWVDGWDTGFEMSGGNQFLGGISRDLTENTNLTYILVVGDRERNPAPGTANGGGGYNHSIVLNNQLTDKLQYVFQTDYRAYQGEAFHRYGVNNFLIYSINDCLGVGGRFEWLHNSTLVDEQDGYQATMGVNYRPHANVLLRPEARYDFGDANFFNGGVVTSNQKDHWTFGVDLIVSF